MKRPVRQSYLLIDIVRRQIIEKSWNSFATLTNAGRLTIIQSSKSLAQASKVSSRSEWIRLWSAYPGLEWDGFGNSSLLWYEDGARRGLRGCSFFESFHCRESRPLKHAMFMYNDLAGARNGKGHG